MSEQITKIMKNIISIIQLFILSFTFTKCNYKTKETKTMEISNVSKTATQEIIVDVRSVKEWNEDGHAECSVNYPLDQFADKIKELKKFDKVILVCRSGNRAGIAKAQLETAGYNKEIENLGSWQNVTCKNK